MAFRIAETFANLITDRSSRQIVEAPVERARTSTLDDRWNHLCEVVKYTPGPREPLLQHARPQYQAPLLRRVLVPTSIVGVVGAALTFVNPALGVILMIGGAVVAGGATMLRYNIAMSRYNEEVSNIKAFDLYRLGDVSLSILGHMQRTVSHAIDVSGISGEALADHVAPLAGELGTRIMWESACDLEAIEHLTAAGSSPEAVSVLRERMILVATLLEEIDTEVVVASASSRGSSDRLEELLEGLRAYREAASGPKRRVLRD